MDIKKINIDAKPGWFSFGVAAILSLTVSFFAFKSISNYFLEYRIKLESTRLVSGSVIQMIDLDADNKDEKVVFKSHNGVAAIEIDQEEDGFYEVYKVGGTWVENYMFYCTGDFDKDALLEIYTFTIKNDTLYLNGFEPFDQVQHFIKDIPVSRIEKHQGIPSIGVSQILMQDVNADGYLELFAILQGGYAMKPRQIIKYDIISDSLFRSPESGASFVTLSFFDLDGDGLKEIITGTSATQNFQPEDTVFLNDNFAWLVILDHKLDLVLVSRKFDQGKPSIYGIAIESDTSKFVFARFTDHNSLDSRLYKYSSKGVLLDSLELNVKDYMRPVNSFTGNRHTIQIVGRNGKLYLYDQDFNLVEEPSFIGRQYTLNYNTSDKAGWMVTTNSDYISLMNSEFDLMARVTNPVNQGNLPVRAGISGAGSKNGMMLHLYDTISAYSMHVYPNPLYRYRYILQAALLILIFGAFYSLFQLQDLMSSNRQKRMIKIHSLQLQNIQNQIHPHFTFNMLNTIGSMIYKEDKELAYEYLNNFSDLVRSVITSSENVSWTIDEELSFIKTYLKLENVRYEQKFRYNIDFKTQLDLSFHIPKLIIQTFVENAIKHGLVHKVSDCKLNIDLSQLDKHLEIDIIDNGIGRAAANKLRQTGNGKGLKIINDYIYYYNRFGKEKFSLDIIDLIDNAGVAEGTRVILKIPVEYVA